MDADRTAQALERAERLEPGEILVMLAQARALAALERYAEAEARLRAVLARRSSHADAERALALLRLRDGAPEEARALARQVLEIDALDEPTGQTLAEAQAAPSALAPRPAKPSRETFAAELERAFCERCARRS